MSFWEIIVLLFIAGLAGSIGQVISGYTLGGCFLSIILGFVGALTGTWIARHFHLPGIFIVNTGDISLPLFWAIAGSILFSVIFSLLNSKKDNKISNLS